MEDNLKTNSKNISKIVASALPAICLSSYNTLDTHAGELLREIQKQQDNLLLCGDAHSRIRVLQRVIKNYDELNDELQNALDNLWSNEAGKLLLRSLCKAIKLDAQRITILWDTHDKDDDTNLFDPTNSTIYLDKSRFGKYVGYCNGELIAKSYTLDAVLFHELCHGLHNLNACDKGATHKVVQKLYKFDENDPISTLTCKAWGNDEEIYTINGKYINSEGKLDFDYLNSNTYMILQALKNDELPASIVQRVYHCSFDLLQTEYLPVIDMSLENFLVDLKEYIDD